MYMQKTKEESLFWMDAANVKPDQVAELFARKHPRRLEMGTLFKDT